MGFLEVEDGRRIYFEHHPGPRQPVVLVHAWGLSVHGWNTVVSSLLENGNEIVLMDSRCCGRSDRDFTDVSIGALSSDVVRLIRHLGIAKPVINGWSIGGAVAVQATADLNFDVAGLVMTGGTTPRYTAADDWPYGGTAEDVEGILSGLASDRVNGMHELARLMCSSPVSPALTEWLARQFLDAGPRVDDSFRHLAKIDQRELLKKIDAPALLMIGSADTILSYEGIAASRDLYQQARLVEFPGCGHAPFLEDPETYRRELLTFLNGLH